jgi:hypothetical protein
VALETGGILVGDEIKIAIELEVIEQGSRSCRVKHSFSLRKPPAPPCWRLSFTCVQVFRDIPHKFTKSNRDIG